MNTFKYYDFEKTGAISIDCFMDVLKYYGCFFNRNELLALFNRYDLNANRKLIKLESISYDEISDCFRNLSQKRRN